MKTVTHNQQRPRVWRCYACASCGGVVLTGRNDGTDKEIKEQYPASVRIADEIPDRARSYLVQCQASQHVPDGAVILAASAVDAMLRATGLKEGNLFQRIDAAASRHLLTAEMAAWAHHVRLGANEQRHADDDVQPATEGEAAQALEFALALAEYLFVLPSRVTRGRKDTAVR